MYKQTYYGLCVHSIKIRNKLPSMILKSIYFAFVRHHLLYGIELYANTSSSHLSKLETLNRPTAHSSKQTV